MSWIGIFTAINGPNIKWNCNLPHKNPCSTRDGAKHVLQNTQYSFKNQRSMHGNYENTLFWSQFKFRITFQLKFLEWNDIKQRKTKEIISTLFCVMKSLELLISV